MSGEPQVSGLQEYDLLQTKIFANQDENSALSEQDLRWLSAGPLASFLKSSSLTEEQIRNAEQIWKRIRITMKSSEISDRHMTATCNAISVFLDSACTSPNENIVALGLSSTTWNDCIALVANVFETGKVKAMRQVLVTLTNLLQTLPVGIKTDGLKKTALANALDVIYTAKPRQQLKASMNVIELMLRRVLDLSDLVDGLKQCRIRNGPHWSRRFARDGMPVSIVSSILETNSDLSSSEDSVEIMYFVFTLWHDMIFTDLHPSVVSLYEATMSKLSTSSPQTLVLKSSQADIAPWAILLERLLSLFPDSVNTFAIHLFPRLIKLDSEEFRKFAFYSPDESSVGSSEGHNTLLIRVAAIQAGRQGGLFSIEDLTTGMGINSEFTISDLLSHANGDVRVRAFSFLVDSGATTEPIEVEVLQIIKQNLQFLYGDSDANTRGEILSVSRRMIIRLRGSAKTKRGDAIEVRERYKIFLSTFVDFLENELGPTCSYQRHISALKVLEILIASGLDPSLRAISKVRLGNDQTGFALHISLHSSSMLSSLLNLLVDPFQEVRTSTVALLAAYLDHITFPTVISSSVAPTAVDDSSFDSSDSKLVATRTLLRAEQLAMRTHRADHADGVGKLYAIQYMAAETEQQRNEVFESLVSRAEKALHEGGKETDFKAPVKGVPLHGLLVGIRNCIDLAQPSSIFQSISEQSGHAHPSVSRLLELCEVVWNRVRSRLCIDAPESEEDDGEGVGGNDVGGPKDLLSYSWRALRDSSQLLGAIISKASSTSTAKAGENSLGLSECQKMGDLCIQQLSELRHRGAFSTVSQTFNLCCFMCAKSTTQEVKALLEQWYQFSLTAIDEQSLRLTRRSAGLPALLASILAPSSQERFNDFMQDFLARAIDLKALPTKLSVDDAAIPLPQVHVLNCLREIVTNSTFRDRTEDWMMSSLKAATICLTCNIWAIRNCGLMLFRACTHRLCRPRDQVLRHVQRPEVMQSSSFIPLARWPESLEVAINVLSENISVEDLQIKMAKVNINKDIGAEEKNISLGPIAPERVFAGLDLLGRIRHSPGSWEQTFPHVLSHLGNTVWLIRDQAARIFAANVDPYESLVGVQQLEAEFESCGENGRHGRLLAISYIIKELQSLPVSERQGNLFGPIIDVLEKLQQLLVRKTSSPMVLSKFVDIINDILKSTWQVDGQSNERVTGIARLFESEISTPSSTPESLSILRCRLQQAVCVNKCLTELIQYQSQPNSSVASLDQTFSQILQDDPNAALVVLKEMLDFQSTYPASSRPLQELLLKCITQSKNEAILVAAMNGMAEILENSDDEPQNLADLKSFFNQSTIGGGRKLWNARLRLQCAILKLSPSTSCLGEDCQLCFCLKSCETALGDETDYATRLNAVQSLRNLLTVTLMLPAKEDSNHKHILQSSLILSHALNDDDEDVRDLASFCEADVYRKSMKHSQRLAPLAANKRLIELLTDSMAPYLSYQQVAIGLITASGTVGKNDPESVTERIKELLDHAQETNDDLFEEEKQNLYADDVRDIQIWAKALCKVDSSIATSEATNTITTWADVGLTQIISLLEAEGEDGPLGLSWKPEVLPIAMRAIICADIALRWTSEVDPKSMIKQKVLDLQTIATKSLAHGPITKHLISIMNSSP